MTLLYLCTLCLYMAGTYLDVVGSDMCDDGWVYNSDTETCLQTISGVDSLDFLMELNDQCANRKGGEFRNISGQVVEFTEAIEPFLRNYLQFMKVSEAGVDLSSWLSSSMFIHNRYYHHRRFFRRGHQRAYFAPRKPVPFQGYVSGDPPVICQVTAGPVEPPVCPRDVTLVSVSDRNATLAWSPGQLGREVVVYITVEICDVSSSCRNFATITFRDVSLFQQMNYTVTGLQPNQMYKLSLLIQSSTFETIDCNVTQSLSTTEEHPACPRNVSLVSVSDTNAVLSWSPGQLGIKVIVKIEVQICVALSCEYFTTRIFEGKSLNPLMNFTVSGLQPNTKYKLVLHMLNDTFETKDCNMTLALQTNEESTAAVVGLAVMLSISLLACSVMAILLFRYYRQAKKDKNSDIDKIVCKMMKQTSRKQETKLQEHKNPETKSALYVNAQVQPHEYEKPIETQDEHIYEA